VGTPPCSYTPVQQFHLLPAEPWAIFTPSQIFFFFLMVLGFKLRTLRLLGRQSITGATPQPHHCTFRCISSGLLLLSFVNWFQLLRPDHNKHAHPLPSPPLGKKPACLSFKVSYSSLAGHFLMNQSPVASLPQSFCSLKVYQKTWEHNGTSL
jgi:hypothetical protein